MADDIRAIKVPWQTRVGVTGQIVLADDALDQFIRVILSTQLGSVPQSPDLGIDWLQIIDMPVDEAMPRLIADTARAFSRWVEPRATLSRVEQAGDNSQLVARVYYVPASGSERTVEVAA